MQVRLTIHGRVQGVNFRNVIRRYAEKRALRGWVRNNSEGTVTAVIQGTASRCKDFQDWVKNSPGFSSVKQVLAQETAEESFTEFTIQRTGFFHDQAQAIKNLGRSL